jgi:hypothetical protein
MASGLKSSSRGAQPTRQRGGPGRSACSTLWSVERPPRRGDDGEQLRHEPRPGLHRRHPRRTVNLPDMVESSNSKRGRRATEEAELTGARRWFRAAPVVGEVGHAFGSCSEVAGEVSRASRSCSEVVGEVAHASGSCSEVVGEVGHASGSCSEVVGEVGHASGSCSEVVGEVGHTTGSCSEVVGGVGHAFGSCSEVVGEVGHASGSCSKVVRCSRTGRQ